MTAASPAPVVVVPPHSGAPLAVARATASIGDSIAGMPAGANFSESFSGVLGMGWQDLYNFGYTWDIAAGTYTLQTDLVAIVGMKGAGFIQRGNNFFTQWGSTERVDVGCKSGSFMEDATCSDWKDGRNSCDVEANRFFGATAHEIINEDGISFPKLLNAGPLKCDPPPPPPSDECGGGDDGDGEWATVCAGDGGGGGWVKVCWQEYIVLEISYDGGKTWSTLWEGYGDVCEYYAEE